MDLSQWRLIISEALPGALNMAFDEVLLDAVSHGQSPPVIRFYLWEKPTVSLGYGQDFTSCVNADFCRDAGLPVVRRITGGRAVIHDCELTYAVVAPEKNALFPGTIHGNYAVIAETLKEAVEKFGIPVKTAPGRRSKSLIEKRDFRYNACFNSPSIHELVVEGCKITGSAQIRRHGFFLQHGSIPVEMDLELAVRALSPDKLVSVEKGRAALARKVGWLNRFSPRPVEIGELRENIIGAFSGRLGHSLLPGEFSLQEEEKAHRLRQSKYENPFWNLQRKTFHGDVRPAG